VYAAYEQSLNQNLDTYDSTYATTLTGATGPVIVIQGGAVTVNGVAIKSANYSMSVLTWSSSRGNASSAVLNFQVLTSDDGKPLPAGSYIGPQFYGTYWLSGKTKPTSTNIFGKVGAAPATPPSGSTTVQATPISTWYDTYQTYLADATGKYQSDSTLTLNSAGVTYKGSAIKNFTYSNQVLSWSVSDGNSTNASLSFYQNTSPTTTNPTPGNQFFGKLWTGTAAAPSSPNFFGQLGSSSNPAAASQAAATASQWQTVGINLGVGIATMLLGTAVIEAIKAFVKWKNAPTQENKTASDNANQEADNAAKENDAVSEEAVEANPEGEIVNPADIPAQAAAEVAEAAAEVADVAVDVEVIAL
jgi:hypothetical protein